MLVLPKFQILRPQTIPEALDALSAGGAVPLAGGTDLIPNLKHGLLAPERLVSLRRVTELKDVYETAEGGLFLGAGITIAEVAAHASVRARYPALAEAASLIAGPQLRAMGTLGGNLCLDTRCLFYNQTQFWRNALGGCIKKEGTVCHVVPRGKRCIAAYSADTPGPLMVYGASLTIASQRGARRMPVTSFFRAFGEQNHMREEDELVLGVTLPKPKPGLQSSYVKLRMRQAIDFPALSVAVALLIGDKERVADVSLVVGGVASQPKTILGAADAARGKL
ncbi:MAG TPA: FAD binding domain-containing protein, partial [Candidatus Eisenbacteria bacterium]|nr:FAD binding domain-containing protein [Candidatus Eisenbacteria bacterium]